MTDAYRTRSIRLLALAILLTTLAEAVYFVVWGLILFPSGNIAAKAVWTLTCGIGMGAVIGAATLMFVEGRRDGASAIRFAAAIVVVIGSYCAWLCSRIDAQFGYFGGSENGLLFLLAGIIPAIFGGMLYGWLCYGRGTSFTRPI